MTKLGVVPGTSNTTITSALGTATIDDVTPVHGKPGAKYWYIDANGSYCECVYVKFIDAVAYVKGGAVFLADDNTPATAPFYIVTNDYSEDFGDILHVAGICYGVQTTGYFGFVQTRGPGIVIQNNDDDGVIGAELIVTGVDNGLAKMATAGASGPQIYIGIETTAVNATTNLCNAWINIGTNWWSE